MGLSDWTYQEVPRIVVLLGDGSASGVMISDVAAAANRKGIRRAEAAAALDSLIASGDVRECGSGRIAAAGDAGRITKSRVYELLVEQSGLGYLAEDKYVSAYDIAELLGCRNDGDAVDAVSGYLEQLVGEGRATRKRHTVTVARYRPIKGAPRCTGAGRAAGSGARHGVVD